jgi:glycosyltransferase involved in cell wall biosynthesis
MRILFDAQQLTEQMTGVGTYSESILRAVLKADQRHEWRLLCHSGNSSYVARLIAGHPRAQLIVLKAPLSLDYRVQQDLLSKLIPEQGIALHFSPSFLAALRETCPSVSVIHDATYVLFPEFQPPGVAEYLHRCVASTCENAARILTVSENSKEDITRIYHVPAERIRVVAEAAHEAFFAPYPEKEIRAAQDKYRLGRQYVLAVNMGNPKKNAKTLIQAFASMDGSACPGLKLVIVGEWDASLVNLPALAKEAGIAQSTIVTGYMPRADLYRVMAGAKVFCFPSLHEGFGLPLLEAMAAGVPVISSNAASLPEVAGEAARLVDPHDVSGWTRALQEVLESPAVCSQLAARGKARSRQFSWEKAATETLKVLEGAIVGSPCLLQVCGEKLDIGSARQEGESSVLRDASSTSAASYSESGGGTEKRSEGLSIIVPAFNDLPYLRLLIEGIRRHSRMTHEIVVVSDGSSDGTDAYLRTNGILSAHLACNQGICTATNIAVSLSHRPWLFLANSDMVPAPGWDVELLKHLDERTVVSATCIEPGLVPVAPIFHTRNCGTDTATFDWLSFDEAVGALMADRTEPGVNYPFAISRALWDAVGGLDPAFNPGPVSDPDLFYRLAMAGARFVRSRASLLYHFSGVSLRRKTPDRWQVAEAANLQRFAQKWGEMPRYGFGGVPDPSPRARARMPSRTQAPVLQLSPLQPEPISLVALLGDEAENVLPFLKIMEPYFDEVIFVSDGRQPESVSRIEEYLQTKENASLVHSLREKIKVFERPLNGDFAAQRNFGNAQCRCEWALHADLDERFDRQLLDSLRDLILAMRRSDKLVCGFPRMNYLDGVLANDVSRQEWTEAGLKACREKARERPSNLDPQFRLMRRDVRWQGRVHETPEPLTRAPQQVMLWTGAAIQHPKTLDRQRMQDARYERIAPGASLGPVAALRQEPPAPLRILMLTTEYPPAQGYGLGRYASELAAALAARGNEVHVVTGNYLGEQGSSVVRGVHVHNEKELFSIRHFDWVGEAVLGNVRSLDRSIEIARRNGPFDAIISHDWLAANCAKALRAIFRVPWLLAMHDTEVGKRGNRLTRGQAYIAEMESWATREADHILTTSEFMRREVAHLYKVPSEKLSAVPCGINARRFFSPTNLEDFRKLFAVPNERLLVYSGRLSPMKGVEELMEAFGVLAAEDRQIRLVIAGEGPLREAIERRLRDTGLLERCCLTGWLGDKALGALYGVADAVLVPSRYEPFGMVALEAAACGTTVIASNVGGLAEIIQHSAGAIVPVPPGDPQQLAATTQAILSDRSRLKEGDSQGRERLVGIYSWERVAGEVLAVLERLTVNPVEHAQRG